MRIVLMGPPGAGKGTQAVRLVDAFGMTHLSSGDIFRAEKASGSELGQQLASYMDDGMLVPDEVVVEMMAGVIGRIDGALMLDGFPGRWFRQKHWMIRWWPRAPRSKRWWLLQPTMK